jgi:hypothetical protein
MEPLKSSAILRKAADLGPYPRSSITVPVGREMKCILERQITIPPCFLPLTPTLSLVLSTPESCAGSHSLSWHCTDLSKHNSHA